MSMNMSESIDEFKKRALEHVKMCGSTGILPQNSGGSAFMCVKCGTIMECGWTKTDNNESIDEFKKRALEHVKICGSSGLAPRDSAGSMCACVKCGAVMKCGHE